VIRTFRSLASVNYRLWFAGALVSNVGAWMQRTAQDWIVLTQLTDNDAFAVGIVMALQFGPILVLGPFTGLIVDRVPGRTLLILTQTAQAVLAFGLGAIMLADVAQLWMVYGFALLLGIVTAVDNPARQTFVGELVPTDDLPNAVALNSASFNSARLIGPAVAGLAMAVFGPGWVFIINGCTFAGVLVALWLLRTNELYPIAKTRRGPGQLSAGFRYVRGRPDILVVLAMVFVIGTFGFNFPIFTSAMSRVEFHLDVRDYGLISSVLAIGSVIGSLLAARREKPRVGLAIGAAAAFGVISLAAALMPNAVAFAIALVPLGMAAMTMTTSANAYVQTTVDPSIRGRVMALYMAVFAGTTLLGGPAVGWVSDAFGPRWGLGVAAIAGGVGALIGLVWLALDKNLRVRRHPDAPWRLTLRYDGDRYDRATATQEIAISETSTERS